MGIACRSASHARPEDLIRDADRALSRARTLGGNRSAIHDPATSGRPLALAELEVALRRALDTDEFREHYQPIVSVKGGQVAGFEVHLWRRSAPAAGASFSPISPKLIEFLDIQGWSLRHWIM